MIPPLQNGQSNDTNFPIKTCGKIEEKMGFLSRKNASGGVITLAILALFLAQPAAAQVTPPTPLPQVIATQQAASNAAAQVGNLQAQRAQTEARLAEINRNIEYQIAAATQAAADARAAAATQNAVEAGAAIGRLEGALAQLRESYAGKDAIISDLQSRLEQQAAQSATDKRAIDALNLQLQQAQRDKVTAVNAYNALAAQNETNRQGDMTTRAINTIAILTLMCIIATLVIYRLSRRGDTVVVTPPPAEDDIINAEIVNANEE